MPLVSSSSSNWTSGNGVGCPSVEFIHMDVMYAGFAGAKTRLAWIDV